MAIITYPLNGINYDATDVETYLSTRTSGVFDDTADFGITITGSREVTIAPGLAWIKNEDFAGKSICNTEDVALSIDLADGTLARIDRIVLKFDKANRVSTLAVLKGTPKANPTAPAITRTADIYMLGLYTVRVPAGSTTISVSNITDTRGDVSVCGRVADGISGLNTVATELSELKRTETVNLTEQGWSAYPPYTQTVSVPGMTAENDWFDYYLDGRPSQIVKMQYDNYITDAYAGNGTVTFECIAERPTVLIPIKIKGF